MRGRTQQFRQSISRPSRAPEPETHPVYWNPNRIGALQAPQWFMEKVEEISGDLDVRFNPVRRLWTVWVRSPRFIHPMCQGWKLLFVHHDGQGGHAPLDERLLARLHFIDMKNDSSKRYFDRIQSEMERDKASRDRQYTQDTLDLAIERGWDHSRISVSMRGKSNGSKFSNYHA